MEYTQQSSAIRPDAATLMKLARDPSCTRIPVYRELMRDDLTPTTVMRRLRAASHHCFLLESALHQQIRSRYTFLGYDPQLEIQAAGRRIVVRDLQHNTRQELDGDVHDVLREVLARNHSLPMEGLPALTGGLVGYFSYESFGYAEPTLQMAKERNFEDVDVMFFNDIIVFDDFRQKQMLITGIQIDPDMDRQAPSFAGWLEEAMDQAEARLDAMQQCVEDGPFYAFEPLVLQEPLQPAHSQPEYEDMVRQAQDYIRQGDIFQVVLSNPLSARAAGSLFDTYRILRSENPSPYLFYYSSEDLELAGASPETLVRLEGNRLETFPLAGTRPVSADAAENDRRAAELLQDPKECAEHNMLVDLGRNDLSKVSVVGSVQVPDYMDVVRYASVMHLASRVSGTLAPGKDALDALRAILPAGTLSGAPKHRACQRIMELEGDERGVYGGAVGYLDTTGNMDVCIAIRMACKKNERLTIRSGAGIVLDSVPEREYAECFHKTASLRKALILARENAQKGKENCHAGID